MAAPSPTARQNPGGIKLRDGFPTLITLAADADVSFWERTVTPPGMDGGDAIDITTMHNTNLRTFTARSLMGVTEVTGTALYDPAVLTQIQSLINVETTITVEFPDGSTVAFFGYLRVFSPQEISEGESPSANYTIQPTNVDPSDHVTEYLPVINSVAGT